MMEEIKLSFKKIDNKAVLPKYSHEDDACMDITATSYEYDVKRNCYVYHTGLAFDIPKGYEMQIRPRSSIRDKDVCIANSPGTIDSGYHGEVLICYNTNYSILDRLKLNKIGEALKKFAKTVKVDDLIDSIGNIDNISDEEIVRYAMSNPPYNVGDKIAQFLISYRPKINLIETESFSSSKRGENGFGSTGQ